MNVKSFNITAELKSAMKAAHLPYDEDAINWLESLPDGMSLTYLDYNEYMQHLYLIAAWATRNKVSETQYKLLKDTAKIINKWKKYMIMVPRYCDNKNQHKLDGILHNVCRVYVETNNYQYFIPTIKEATTLVDYLGKYIQTTPDLPYQWYIVRKTAYQILNRLIKDDVKETKGK